MRMLGDFLVVLGQVATLFLMMAVGFVLVKIGKMSEETTSQMSFLLLYVVCPCIILESMQADLTQGLLSSLGKCLLAFCLLYGISILLTIPMFPSRDSQTRPVLHFGMIFANSGFMGIPLVEAVIGPDAVIFASVNLVVFMLFQWTYGVILMGGKASFRKIILSPSILAILAGAVLMFTGLRLPSPVNTAISFLADLNTPLAMVVIGALMARANIPDTFRHYRLFEASAVRLILIPAIALVVLIPFHLDPVIYTTVVLLSATPSAGATSILAVQFHRNATAASQLVTLSTLLSIVTLPVFALIARTVSA